MLRHKSIFILAILLVMTTACGVESKTLHTSSDLVELDEESSSSELVETETVDSDSDLVESAETTDLSETDSESNKNSGVGIDFADVLDNAVFSGDVENVYNIHDWGFYSNMDVYSDQPYELTIKEHKNSLIYCVLAVNESSLGLNNTYTIGDVVQAMSDCANSDYLESNEIVREDYVNSFDLVIETSSEKVSSEYPNANAKVIYEYCTERSDISELDYFVYTSDFETAKDVLCIVGSWESLLDTDEGMTFIDRMFEIFDRPTKVYRSSEIMSVESLVKRAKVDGTKSASDGTLYRLIWEDKGWVLDLSINTTTRVTLDGEVTIETSFSNLQYGRKHLYEKYRREIDKNLMEEYDF